MKILVEGDSHRYLTRQLCTFSLDRINIKFQNRSRAAWAAFHKHKCVVLDHNISLRLRLNMFTPSIGPALMIGTPVLLPQAGYDSNYFQSTFDDVERLIMEACDKR